MKYIVWISLILSILIASMSLSYASGEENAAINSWSPAWQRIACVGDDVYAKGPAASFTGITSLYLITSGKPKAIAHDVNVEEIKACGSNLVLLREEKTIAERLANAPGKTVVEFLNLQTMKKEEWARYKADASSIVNSFCVKERLFSVLREEDGVYLASYIAPHEVEKVKISDDAAYNGQEYPSFYLVEYHAEKQWFSPKYKLTIYDYETGEKYSSKEGLDLAAKDRGNYIELQAVFSFPEFLYLAPSSIRCWNVENQSDTELLSFTPNHYDQFTWLGSQVLLYDQNQQTAYLYDLATKQLLKSYALEQSVGEAIIMNDLMYTSLLYNVGLLSLHDGSWINISLKQ